MNPEKRRVLEEAGFVFGDAEDFLGLTEDERRLVELRLAVSRAVRECRQKLNLTQAEAARRLKSSQSRVAKLEAGASDVSLDLMFRGLFALGGSLNDLRLTKRSQTYKSRSVGRPAAATTLKKARSGRN